MQFQAKAPKSKNRAISEIINTIKPEFQDKAATTKYTSWGGLPILQSKSDMADGRHLDWGCDIIKRFTESHANDAGTSKRKPEAKFQYGGRLFSETGNSNISAVDWAILSKFGVRIVFSVLNCDTSPKRKPEVHLRHRGRHLGRSI